MKERLRVGSSWAEPAVKEEKEVVGGEEEMEEKDNARKRPRGFLTV